VEVSSHEKQARQNNPESSQIKRRFALEFIALGSHPDYFGQ
jgi:hypothetical protein